MANSTTNLDELNSGQSQKEVTANDLFDALSPASLFGRRATTTSGLTWGYYGGTISDGGTPGQIPNGTVTLTNNATNYLEFDPGASPSGIQKNTVGWTGGASVRLYKIITSGGAVTSYEDWRPSAISAGGSAVTGPATSVTNSIPVFADTSGTVLADATGAYLSGGSLGVGIAAPLAKIQVNANGTGSNVSAGPADTLAHLSQTDGSELVIALDSYADRGSLIFRRAQGTAAAKSAVMNGQSLMQIGASGYGSTGYSSGPRTFLLAFAAETWTDSAQGAYSSIFTTAAGTTSTTEKFRVTSEGGTVLGGQAALATNATAGFTYFPSCAGTPTGTPNAFTGKVPFVFDTTNNRAYYYNSSWIQFRPINSAADVPVSDGSPKRWAGTNVEDILAEIGNILQHMPYDVGGGATGAPAASLVLLRYPFPREVRFPASFANSQGRAGTAATAQTDFGIRKNGVSVGTMRFAAAASTATFIAATSMTFEQGDVLTVVAPGSPDATLADIGFALRGERDALLNL